MSAYRPVDPKQSFPELEERVLERWRERDVFQRSLRLHSGAETWSFYEGPPTANGAPGSHHVLSRVFKDVYPRYRAMRGYQVPRKAGWDCHGLPVELEVEKELGISSKAEIEAYGIAEFNKRCRESVFRYVEEWNRLTERIGFWLDLDDPYVTLTNEYIESVWWSLRQIWDQGRLYQGNKVVPYCPRCGTALSSHEVALGYRDVEDPAVFVNLPVEQAPAASSARPGAAGSQRPRAAGDPEPAAGLYPGDQLLVWTTTPWTLISNAAVAVGPKIEYVRARASDGQVYVVAAARMADVLGEGAEALSRFPGSALAGTRYEPPFPYISDYGPHGHSVLEADFVSTEEGTGLVHTAIAFGEDDYRLGEQYGITLQNPVREDGTFDERISDFEGRFVKEADADIVEALRSAGRLYRDETIVHAYPHCWRCETPLLYYAKSSWYIRTTDVRNRMLAENEEIGWHPEHIRQGRFGKWLEGNVDWAISRERFWGTPLPVWECTTDGCSERFCAGSMQDLRERGGEVPDDLHRPYVDEVVLRCAECGGEMRRVGEVIDTWYDSGAMPFAQFHYPFEGNDEFEHRFPADFICEAIDQTRGWFYSLLAVSTLLFDGASYRNAVCLGLILDPDGQKMSKSRGNVVEPWDVISTHGADALRWYYLTSQQPWAGYRFSLDTVGESVRQFLLTLWNTYSFWVLYANAEGIEPASPPPLPEPGEALGDGAEPAARVARELDRWALSRLQATKRSAGEHLERFDSTNAGQAIAAYVEELSNWYVRLSRRRFWEGDAAAFATLRHCLVELAALLAPFTPFVAEEIYLNLAGGEDEQLGDAPDSVHLLDYPEPEPSREDRELEAAMEATRQAVELGRAARSRAGVKARQPLRRAVVAAPQSDREGIAAMADLVTAELNVKGLEFAPTAPEGEGWGVESEGEGEALRAVALDLEIDDELRLEGLARGIVRAIQNERKSAGLEITDRIELTLGGDSDLVAAARAHEEYVTGETLATSISYDGDADASPTKVEGKELRVALTPLPRVAREPAPPNG